MNEQRVTELNTRIEEVSTALEELLEASLRSTLRIRLKLMQLGIANKQLQFLLRGGTANDKAEAIFNDTNNHDEKKGMHQMYQD